MRFPPQALLLAVLAYVYQPTPERLARLEQEAHDLIKTQDADG